VFADLYGNLNVEGHWVAFTFWDTAEQVHAPFSIFLIFSGGLCQTQATGLSKHPCSHFFYDVSTRVSFDNILTKWKPEIDRFCPGTPIILAGTKIDLREEYEKNHPPGPLIKNIDKGLKIVDHNVTHPDFPDQLIVSEEVVTGILRFTSLSGVGRCLQVCRR